MIRARTGVANLGLSTFLKMNNSKMLTIGPRINIKAIFPSFHVWGFPLWRKHVISILLRRHLYMETDPSPLDKASLWGLQSFRCAWNFLNYQALLACISLSLRSDTVKCQQGGPQSSILLAPCKRYPPPIHMMMSSNLKHFPRNWPFVRGIHRSRWIPHTKASDAELWCFLWSASE